MNNAYAFKPWRIKTMSSVLVTQNIALLMYITSNYCFPLKAVFNYEILIWCFY